MDPAGSESKGKNRPETTATRGRKSFVFFHILIENES
jgi:hypothetical protein